MNLLSFDELWDRLNHCDESVAIEAKRATKIDRSILETVSAFSNTTDRGGGYLLLGISQSDGDLFGEPSFVITGVGDPGELQADLATQCRDSLRPPVRPVVTVEERQSKVVLVVFVAEAPAQEKPVFVKDQGLPRGAYLRVGSTDQHCTEDDLAVLFQDRGATTYDETPVEGASVEDVDPMAVAEYRRARREVNPSASELALSDDELLHALHATAEISARKCLTIAGLVLFGKEASLRRHFSMTRVDYIRAEGREWVPDPEKRFSAVEMRGPLLTLVPRVVQQVLSDIPMTFSLGESGLHRRDLPLIPRTVIREAVVNAVMHRSYRVRSPMQIVRYSNRLEIRNPGHSLKPDDRLGEPGSVARNEKIAAALHEAGLAETKGTGIRAMREAMSSANLTLPIFESDYAKDDFTVRLLVHHLLGPDDLAWLARFADCDLSPDEAKALLVVREMGAIDNAVYRDINRVDTLTASAALRKLRGSGLLDMRGKGSATYYVPTMRVSGPESSNRPASGRAATGAGQNPPINTRTERFPAQSEGFPAQSEGFPAQSEGFPAQSEGLHPPVIRVIAVPIDIAWEVKQLGSRPLRNHLWRVIERLCEWQPLRASELAKILRKNLNYLRSEHLSKMIDEGRLEYTIPQTPAHPQQAYRRRSRQNGGAR